MDVRLVRNNVVLFAETFFASMAFRVGHSRSRKDVLATVVVAYITLVAPAEIVLFIERQLSDEGALAAGRHLALAIDVTNVMQTVRNRHIRDIIRPHCNAKHKIRPIVAVEARSVCLLIIKRLNQS